MMSYQETIKSILLNENVELRSLVRDHGKSTMTRKLSVMMMLLKEDASTAAKRYPDIINLIEEHDIMLPEEEAELDGIVKKVTEEGEGAAPAGDMNVTAGIDSSTPRIWPKGKKKDAEAT